MVLLCERMFLQEITIDGYKRTWRKCERTQGQYYKYKGSLVVKSFLPWTLPGAGRLAAFLQVHLWQCGISSFLLPMVKTKNQHFYYKFDLSGAFEMLKTLKMSNNFLFLYLRNYFIFSYSWKQYLQKIPLKMSRDRRFSCDVSN